MDAVWLDLLLNLVEYVELVCGDLVGLFDFECHISSPDSVEGRTIPSRDTMPSAPHIRTTYPPGCEADTCSSSSGEDE